MKYIRRNKLLITIIIFIFALLMINLIYFIKTTAFWTPSLLPYLNTYSMWYCVKNEHIGSIILMLTPFLIIMPCLQQYIEIRKSGLAEIVILKKNYCSFLIQQITHSYKKSILILPLIYLILLIVTFIIFPNQSFYYISGYKVFQFADDWIHHPYLYIMIMTFFSYILSIFFINVGYIVARKEKNFFLVVIKSFLIINFYNYLFSGIIMQTIYEITGWSFFNSFNIYFLYDNGPIRSVWTTGLAGCIHLLISFIVLYLSYKNKERFILENE